MKFLDRFGMQLTLIVILLTGGLLSITGVNGWGFIRTALITMFFSITTNTLIKILVKKRRRVVTRHVSVYAFPSNHAQTSFCIATLVFYYNPVLSVFFYLTSLYVSYTRIKLGVHDLTDVIAGASIGVLLGGAIPALL